MQYQKDQRSRRAFNKMMSYGAAALASYQFLDCSKRSVSSYSLRLGGQVFDKYENPDQWILALKRLGYSAAYCPVRSDASDDVVNAYAAAAEKANIIIAEVGAWSNPISPDDETREKAMEYCCTQLALADRIGARCCVNTVGSRSPESKSGPHPDNLTDDTFDLIVETTRSIIDQVNPTRTFFTLETMPWSYPDSTESYQKLFKAIGRKQFAVHFDPVNLVCSPQRYFKNGDLIREFIQKLGPYIKSCHAKDSLLSTKLTSHIDEVRPGLGKLDYHVFLTELSNLPDIPVMIEHLKTAEEYAQAAEYIRATAEKVDVSII